MKKLFLSLIIGAALVLSAAGAVSAAEITDYTITLLQEGGFPHPYSSENEPEGIRDIIESALAERVESIEVDAPSLGMEELARVYEDTINHAPKLSYVIGSVGIEETDGGYIIYPTYISDPVDLMSAASDRKVIQQAIDDILAQVKPGMSDIEKLLAVHDYIVLNYEYDFTFSIYSAEEFFLNKRGVCQSYTLAMEYIMDELGIRNTYALSDPMNHIWNLVNLDGKWYHIDATWDDPNYYHPVASEAVAYGDVYGAVKHDHFLISDDAMIERGHYMWNTGGKKATSTIYDEYFWNEISEAMQYYNGVWYWCNRYGTESMNAGINSYKFSGDLLENVIDSNNIKTAGVYNGYIYFLTKKNRIYMTPVKNTKEIAPIGEFQDYDDLNGLYFYGGRLLYALASDEYYEKKYSSRYGDMAAYSKYYNYRSYYNIDLSKYKYGDYAPGWSFDDGVLSIGCNSGVIPDYGDFEKPWGEYADEITSIVIRDKVTEIGDNVFSDLPGVSSISMPDTLETIGSRTFAYCPVKMLTIPKSVKYIGDFAFAYCSDLAVIFMGQDIETIGKCAFYSCGNIAEVYYTGSEQDFDGIEIGDWNRNLTDAVAAYEYKPPMLMHIFEDDNGEMVILWLRDNKAVKGKNVEYSLKAYANGKSYNYSGAEYTYDPEIISMQNDGVFYALNKGNTDVSVRIGDDEKSFKIYVGEANNTQIIAYFGYGVTPILASYDENGTLIECRFLDPNEINSSGIDYVDYGGVCKMLVWDDINNIMYPAGPPLILSGAGV